jgi:hypothetical protein
MNAKTFKHSGDMGDIIYSLPAIRAMGGGVLFLDPNGGRGQPLILQSGIEQTRLNEKSIASLTPLLLRCQYIYSVGVWHGQKVEIDLDQFRRNVRHHNLADSHLETFGFSSSERDTAWLEIDDPIVDEKHPIVINRTFRYQSNHVWWAQALPGFIDQAMFVGHPKEHEMFEETFCRKIHYRPTEDCLAVARVIAGCRQFIGNQSFPHSLAEAMKKPLINEVYGYNPAAVFRREGAQYV